MESPWKRSLGRWGSTTVGDDCFREARGGLGGSIAFRGETRAGANALHPIFRESGPYFLRGGWGDDFVDENVHLTVGAASHITDFEGARGILGKAAALSGGEPARRVFDDDTGGA